MFRKLILFAAFLAYASGSSCNYVSLPEDGSINSGPTLADFISTLNSGDCLTFGDYFDDVVFSFYYDDDDVDEAHIVVPDGVSIHACGAHNVQLFGPGPGFATAAILLEGSAPSVIECLSISNFYIGIYNGADGAVISNNHIGVSPNTAFPYGNGYGIIANSKTYIGPRGWHSKGNTISGNLYAGIAIFSCGADWTTIENNYIGTDSQGQGSVTPLGISSGQTGIFLEDVSHVSIKENVISGNSGDGISINQGSRHIFVWSNFIGTDKWGENAIPNGVGIRVSESWKVSIGGTSPWCDLAKRHGCQTHANVISGNLGHGIVIEKWSAQVSIWENIVGLKYSDNTPLGNGDDGIHVRYDSREIWMGSFDGYNLKTEEEKKAYDEHVAYLVQEAEKKPYYATSEGDAKVMKMTKEESALEVKLHFEQLKMENDTEEELKIYNPLFYTPKSAVPHFPSMRKENSTSPDQLKAAASSLSEIFNHLFKKDSSRTKAVRDEARQTPAQRHSNYKSSMNFAKIGKLAPKSTDVFTATVGKHGGHHDDGIEKISGVHELIVSSNGGNGIYVSRSEEFYIGGATVGGNDVAVPGGLGTGNGRNGIYIFKSKYGKVENVAVVGNRYDGISIEYSKRVNVEECEIGVLDGPYPGYGNAWNGISVSHSYDICIDDNLIGLNGLDGIHGVHTGDNLIKENSIGVFFGFPLPNGDDGIDYKHSHGLYIGGHDGCGNQIGSHPDDGISVKYSEHVKVKENFVGAGLDDDDFFSFGNAGFGISFKGVDEFCVEDNFVGANGGDGIALHDVDEGTITCNFIGGFDGEGDGNAFNGVWIANAEDLSIRYNEIGFNGWNGVEIFDSEDVDTKDNEVFDNWKNGIFYGNSKNCDIKDNSVGENSNNGILVAHVTCFEIKNNEVGFDGEGDNFGNGGNGIALVDGTCRDVKVKENVIGYNEENGILIKDSNDIVVYNNLIGFNGEDGIFIDPSHDINIVNNLIGKNDGNGIGIDQGGNVDVHNNGIGVGLDGTPLPNGGNGISITGGSNNNNIHDNEIAFNKENGVNVDNSPDNSIVNNYIHQNEIQGISTSGNLTSDGTYLTWPLLRKVIVADDGQSVTYYWTLVGTAGEVYTIHFYYNVDNQLNGGTKRVAVKGKSKSDDGFILFFDQGDYLIGDTNITMGAEGSGDYSYTINADVSTATSFVVTASTSSGATSQFSNAVLASSVNSVAEPANPKVKSAGFKEAEHEVSNQSGEVSNKQTKSSRMALYLSLGAIATGVVAFFVIYKVRRSSEPAYEYF